MGGIGAWTNWSRNPTGCRRPYAWAAHHLESIPKEERPRVAKGVPGQEQIHLPVRCPGGAHAHGLHNATDHAILIIAVGMALAAAAVAFVLRQHDLKIHRELRKCRRARSHSSRT